MKLQNEGDRSREQKGGGTPGPAIKMFLRKKRGKTTHWTFFFSFSFCPRNSPSAQWLQIFCVGVNSFAQGHGMVRDKIRGKTAKGWT